MSSLKLQSKVHYDLVSNGTETQASKTLDTTANGHKHQVTQHQYRDYAHEMVDTRATPERRRNVSFPIKLHEMLEKTEQDGLAFIVSWQHHGRCFVVNKPEEFVKYVLPQYFQHSTFKSFQRQLNRYCFSQINTGRDKGSYYHELFLRGKPCLSIAMVRLAVKGTGVRRSHDLESEPDFYSMPQVISDTVHKNSDNVRKNAVSSAKKGFSNNYSNLVHPFAVSKPWSLCDQTNTNRLIDTQSFPKKDHIMTQADLDSMNVDPNQQQMSNQMPIGVYECSCNDDYPGIFLSWLQRSCDERKKVYNEMFLYINDIVPDDDPDFCNLVNDLMLLES